MPSPPPESRITLEFDKFSAFVEDYASNISMSGVFLRTDELRPVGSTLDFEFKLVDGFRLVQGVGEVAWLRLQSTGPERPAGMALRLKSLDDKGRELFLKIMEEQVKKNAESFDVEAVPEDALRPGMPQPGVESKILDQDGFTLLEADGSRPGPATKPDRAFEQLEFDAPWGERLPEIPEEVLGEGLEGEVKLPKLEEPPGQPAPEPRQPPLEAPAPSPPAHVASGADPSAAAAESRDDRLRDAFRLAEEAADEIQMAPAFAGPGDGGDPEEVDFGLTLEEMEEGGEGPELEGEDEEPLPDFEPDLLGMDADFDRDFESVPVDGTETAAPEAAAAPGALAAEPAFDDEDPTLVTAEATPLAPAASEDVDALRSEAVPKAGDSPTRPAAPVAAAPVAAASAPAAPAPAAPVAAASAPAAPAPAAPADPVPDDEDDLFAEPAGSGVGRVLRQAAGGWKTAATVAMLLAAAGAAYVFREPLGELIGLTSPTGETTAAPPRADASHDAVPGETGDAAAGGASAEDVGAAGDVGAAEDFGAAGRPAEVGESESDTVQVAAGPPVIRIPPEPEADPALATEPAAGASEEPASAEEPSPPSAGAATRVARLSWQRSEGGTLVIVELDGDLGDDRYVHVPLAYTREREMIRLQGIVEPYTAGRIEVGSPEVLRIRTGHHPNSGGAELHVVFDFPAPGPRIDQIRGLGHRLEILVTGG